MYRLLIFIMAMFDVLGIAITESIMVAVILLGNVIVLCIAFSPELVKKLMGHKEPSDRAKRSMF